MPDLSSINPYTEETFAHHECHDEKKIEAILDAVSTAQRRWRATSIVDRANVLQAVAERLDDRRDALAELCTREMGKLIREARSEVEKCAWVCRYYAEHGASMLADEPLADEEGNKSFVARQPLGTLLAIMPWNFPYWQAFRCAAPALMAGNTVVLKHAGNVSGCALAIEQLFSGLDGAEQIFRTLLVSGSHASELIGDERIAATSLTGSDRAGSSVGAAAGEHLKPSVLELGGSDPFVVLDLDDEAKVLDTAVQARYMNSGQSCIAAKRFIVLDSVYDRFLEGFVSRASQRAMGDPTDEETGLAPMARDDLRDEVHEQVENARKRGARVVIGGDIPSRKGYFYPATVLADVPEDARAYREEVFGPVALVFRVPDEEAAVVLANDSPFGLGGSVWSCDVGRALAVARAIESGAVYVNRQMASDPRLPFGGIKRSGYGRELSHLGIREFVNEKTISVALGD